MFAKKERHGRIRTGITVMEATVALVVVASAALVGARTLFSAAGHRRAAAQREAATLEIANVMERMMAGERSTATREIRPLSASAARVLPQGELTVSIEEPQAIEASEVLSQRMTVELRWKNTAGQWAAPAQVSAWRHFQQSSEVAP